VFSDEELKGIFAPKRAEAEKEKKNSIMTIVTTCTLHYVLGD
jgi:hypothetical protein